MKSVFSVAFFAWVAAVSCDAYGYKPSCRKVEDYARVSCGYPGISKKECLKDCHCCFDDEAYKSKTQCFFREPPPAAELCCNVKKRVACHLKGRNLDDDPYTCRQLGCCFDASVVDQPKRQRRRRRKGRYGGRYGGGRRRPGRYGYRGRGYGSDSYGYGKEYGKGYGNGYGNGYGDWPPHDQPRCFQTQRNCCQQLIKHVDATERKMASYGSVTRRQCLRNRNACWDGDKKPQCFYKFKPCRCAVNSLKCKPCGDDYDQHRLDRSHSKCIAAGCCYRATSYKSSCIEPRRRRRGRNAADEELDGMDDPLYDDYEYDYDNDNSTESTQSSDEDREFDDEEELILGHRAQMLDQAEEDQTQEGQSEDGQAEEGLVAGARSQEDQTEEDQSEEDQVQEDQREEGQAEEGLMVEGRAHEDQTEEEQMEEGRAEEGLMVQGRAQEDQTVEDQMDQGEVVEHQAGKDQTEEDQTEEEQMEEGRAEEGLMVQGRAQEDQTESDQREAVEHQMEKDQTEEDQTEEEQMDEGRAEEGLMVQGRAQEDQTEEEQRDEGEAVEHQMEKDQTEEDQTEEDQAEDHQAEVDEAVANEIAEAEERERAAMESIERETAGKTTPPAAVVDQADEASVV